MEMAKQERLAILLIQPEQGQFVYRRIFHPGVEIPLNLLCLSSYLAREGIGNRVLDMRISLEPQAELDRALASSQPRVVGISACTTEIENAGKVAERVKRWRRDVPVILGGHHASALPRETLQECPDIDYLIVGEGEVALTRFLEAYLKGEDVAGVPSLVWREGDTVRQNMECAQIKDLDSLPLPNREGLDWNKYVPSPGTGNYMRLPSSGILASRGCPYNCNYCSKGVFHRSIRFRSPENVVQEIEHCMDRYGIRDFRFYDDVLTYSKWDLQGFCDLLLRKKLDITWNCYSRVNFITMEKLQMMKRAGCYHIKYGIEFGTEKALKLANKQATLEQARKAVQLTKKAGVECKGNFILGIPGETLEDCEATIRFARELSPDLVSFYPYDAFPGTHFYIKMKEGGEALPRLPRKETEALASRAYLSFYLRPAYIVQRARRIWRHPKREMQVIYNGMSMMSKFYLKNGLLWNTLRRAPSS